MTPFAELLERLVFTPARNGRIALLRDWIATRPDPERGFGLAAITGELSFAAAKSGLIRALAAERTDPVLFAWSYDYVGDLAETVSLIWPVGAGVNAAPPSLEEVVVALATATRADLPGIVSGWLDTLDASARLALLKLITGGLRVGVSARLAKVALAEQFGRSVDEIEEAWPAVSPPYRTLFHWLEGAGPQPRAADAPVLRPLMLANPLDEGDLAAWGKEHRPDIVIESVGGTADTPADALRVVRRGGRIVILGTFGTPKAIDLQQMMRKEVSLIGSFCYGTGDREPEFTTAARMTGRWRDELRALTSHQFPLERVAEAFATADDKATGAISYFDSQGRLLTHQREARTCGPELIQEPSTGHAFQQGGRLFGWLIVHGRCCGLLSTRMTCAAELSRWAAASCASV